MTPYPRRKKQPLNYTQALNYSLRLLQQRSYSEFKLRQKLTQHATEPEVINQVVDTLIKLNLINDERFAENLIRTHATYRHTSSRVIAGKLYQKGVTKETIENQLNAAGDIPTETERARHHAGRFWKKRDQLEPAERKQKLFANLARKGFSLSIIQAVYRELMEDNTES